MLKVGITGGIGSGKSTVCNLFKCLDIPVFNADEAGRYLLSEDVYVIEKVVEIFGHSIITGVKPDRKKIAELVFRNPEKLALLNSIIHPAVRKKFNEWVSEQNSPYVIDEAAILFETGIYKQLDTTILVTAPEELRINRVMHRDGTDAATIRDRMKNQWTDEQKKALTDFVIINDDVNPLLPQVNAFHESLLKRAK